MWWGLIASDFLAKPAKLASRWRHNFSLVPELQMLKSLPLPIPCLDPDIATLKTPTAPEHTLVLDSPHSPTEARITP
jgi:hypothetical protein